MIAPTLRTTMLDIHGPTANAWLDDLPILLADCAHRWRLTLEPPFAPLSYAYVAPAVRDDGTAVVLKAAPPGRGLNAERAALAAFGGWGAVELLDADEAGGSLLLRRVLPGTSLIVSVQSGRDDDATRAAADVMRALHRPSVATDFAFPTVADWARGLGRLRQRFDGGTGPLRASLVERAESTLAELIATSAPAVLLHGDLHHGNVLQCVGGGRDGVRAGRWRDEACDDVFDGVFDGWLAIDPQGVLGEPACEVGALLRNPLPWLLASGTRAARDVSARRIAILSESLGIERPRLAAWGAALAVLSAWWSVEDHGRGWEGAIGAAEVLFALAPRV